MKKIIKIFILASIFIFSLPVFASDRIFPLWSEEARARGYELPEPFGVSISHMGIRQNIDVDEIGFSHLKLSTPWGIFPLEGNMVGIEIGNTRQRNNTETLRLDAWVLPFMNVYGIVAYTKGHSISNINAISFAGYREPTNLKFRLDFKGTTYGAGTTFAGGYKDFFGTLDVNFTQTKFDVLDGQINALTVTPRIGYRFTTPAIKNFNIGEGKMNIWVGSMYQKVDQVFKGKLSDLNFPSELQEIIDAVNMNDEGKFKVKQHITNPWNMLVGARYEPMRNFAITMEAGFLKRNQFFASAEYRF